jgi:putative transposase
MEFNGEVDHVHLLIALPPNLDLSVFVNNLKTTSSRLIRKEFAAKMNRVYRKPVFWSRSYCIISCGGAPLSILKQYIEQQRSPNDEEESSRRAEIPRRTAFSHPRPH